METFVINIPDKKIILVKQLLEELGVTIKSVSPENSDAKIPNALTIETIENARKGIGLAEPIKNIDDFFKNL